jgi:hypothetical protein
MNSRRDMCRHVFHVLFVYHLKSNCNQIVISRLEFIFSEQKSTKKHSVIVYKYNIAHKISHYNTKYIIILYHINVVLFCVTQKTTMSDYFVLFCIILYYIVHHGRRPGPGLVRGQGPPRRRWRSGRAPASDHLYTG